MRTIANEFAYTRVFNGSQAQNTILYFRSFDMRHTLSLLTLAIVAVYLMAVSVEETQAYSYSGPRYNRAYNGPANRINRRGFKSSLLSTARGFGKRSDPSVSS